MPSIPVTDWRSLFAHFESKSHLEIRDCLQALNVFERLNRRSTLPLASPHRKHNKPSASIAQSSASSSTLKKGHLLELYISDSLESPQDTLATAPTKRPNGFNNSSSFGFSSTHTVHHITTQPFASFQSSRIPIRIGAVTTLPRISTCPELSSASEWASLGRTILDSNSSELTADRGEPSIEVNKDGVITYAVVESNDIAPVALPVIDSRFSMSSKENVTEHLINTLVLLEGFLMMFDEVEEGKVSLVVDLEGCDHGREGILSTVQFSFAHEPKTTYVVDIYVLREKAFGTVGENGKSIQIILEDPDVYKVVFDVCQDSAALHGQWGINLAGVVDLRLMDLACRDYSRRYLSGLDKCIRAHGGLSTEELDTWSVIKTAGKRYAEDESKWKWILRPIPEVLLHYAANDTIYMPAVYDSLQKQLVLFSFWNDLILKETANRVKQSQEEDFESSGAQSPSAFVAEDYYSYDYDY
ncbi:hypothetical protein EG329_008040 [Mollisiaceae sp. DMI_Dod_QoI]|nr:hypothetical protein EG329_008040 [Helotiales sp. DMI_Dod_QoI]